MTAVCESRALDRSRVLRVAVPWPFLATCRVGGLASRVRVWVCCGVGLGGAGPWRAWGCGHGSWALSCLWAVRRSQWGVRPVAPVLHLGCKTGSPHLQRAGGPRLPGRQHQASLLSLVSAPKVKSSGCPGSRRNPTGHSPLPSFWSWTRGQQGWRGGWGWQSCGGWKSSRRFAGLSSWAGMGRGASLGRDCETPGAAGVGS